MTDAKESGARGGRARAASLSKEERREIAKKAAAARWGADLPKAAFEGVLRVGDLEFQAAVLEDEKTRVISETQFMKTMGIYRSGALSVRREEEGGARIPLSLAFKNLKLYVDKHLGDVHSEISGYRTLSGNIAKGTPAEVIPKICEVWIDADRDGVLGRRQKIIAKKADILLRGLAHTGIVALVDEATGFQAHREQNALAKYLERYVAKEFRQWVRTFPRSFFEELCRLRGIPFPKDMRLPQYFGKIVNNLVYDRLAPGLRRELEEKNPTGPDGRRKTKHHQWLTEDVGHPRLLHHLGLVEGIGKGFDGGEWDAFMNTVNKRIPKPDASLPLFADLEEDEG